MDLSRTERVEVAQSESSTQREGKRHMTSHDVAKPYPTDPYPPDWSEHEDYQRRVYRSQGFDVGDVAKPYPTNPYPPDWSLFPPRPFTDREREDYHMRVCRSQGFDVGDVTDVITLEDQHIRPVLFDKCLFADEGLKTLENSSKLAIDLYNNCGDKTKYWFVKLLKANRSYSASTRELKFYITFQAEDEARSQLANFQALSLRVTLHGEERIVFCRPEPQL